MAVIRRSWADEVVMMDGVGVTSGSYSSPVDLQADGYEGAHVTVQADFPASPTDDLEVYVQASLDGVGWDDTPLLCLTIARGTDPNQVSFVVRDVARFRLYCKRSGGTDTIVVTAKCRPWRYTSVG
ncbi:MAG TPA: hypothetical protein ENN81_12495 [Phycisphaerales bacterium]|nr:hypothetical protein [Phycisphaerales bacterium]